MVVLIGSFVVAVLIVVAILSLIKYVATGKL